jgi:hypothetical protein
MRRGTSGGEATVCRKRSALFCLQGQWEFSPHPEELWARSRLLSVVYWGLHLRCMRNVGLWPLSDVEIKNVPTSAWCLLTRITPPRPAVCSAHAAPRTLVPYNNWCPKHMSWPFDVAWAVPVKSSCSARYPVVEQMINPATVFQMLFVRRFCPYLEAICIPDLCWRDPFNRQYFIYSTVLRRKRPV